MVGADAAGLAARRHADAAHAAVALVAGGPGVPTAEATSTSDRATHSDALRRHHAAGVRAADGAIREWAGRHPFERRAEPFDDAEVIATDRPVETVVVSLAARPWLVHDTAPPVLNETRSAAPPIGPFARTSGGPTDPTDARLLRRTVVGVAKAVAWERITTPPVDAGEHGFTPRVGAVAAPGLQTDTGTAAAAQAGEAPGIDSLEAVGVFRPWRHAAPGCRTPSPIGA